MEVRKQLHLSGSELGIMSGGESYGGGGVGLQKTPVSPQPSSMQSMRLAFSPDGTAVYKPINSSPPSYPASGGGGGAVGGEGQGPGPGPGPTPTTIVQHNLNTTNMSEPMKRKRGRPRKYGPDGTMALALAPAPVSSGVPPSSVGSGGGVNFTSAISPSSQSKKARGRPPGSSKKHQMAALGSSGIGFTPHVITVDPRTSSLGLLLGTCIGPSLSLLPVLSYFYRYHYHYHYLPLHYHLCRNLLLLHLHHLFVNLIMGPRRRRYQRWYTQPLAPLIEGPDPDTHGEGGKKEKSWDIIRAWVRSQVEKGSSGGGNFPISIQGNVVTPPPDLKLLLGVLGCPLAPVSLLNDPISHISIKDTPIETSSAHYIIQQYLAATGCLKLEKCVKSSYVVGTVKMVCCETEIASGKNVRSVGTRGGENGCFVLWQMSPGMWSVEMVVAGNKVVAGSNGKIVWRHVPWLGTHAAKGPQRPLRRIIQGLDPKSTASMFARAQCLGEKRIENDDCFVLKVAADRATIVERSDGPAEVIRHVLYGYFSQRSGLLVYMEDSHLTRVQALGADTVYWETTIGSTIEDYRQVDGVLIAHGGRSVATVFRFGEVSMQHCRTRMEETWTIDDVVFNVPGLSMDYFIPPADILDATSHI